MLVRLVYDLCGLFPLSLTSSAAGTFAATVGPLFSRTNIARRNLARAIPGLDEAERHTIIKNMWDNVGRTFVEYPAVASMDQSGIRHLAELKGIEHIRAADKAGKGSIFFTGHLGNFEVGPRLFAAHGFPLHVVYRHSNNPGLNNLIHTLRNRYLAGSIPKGKAGARQMINILKSGGRIGIMLDQKMNDGIPVPFFGMDAMTAPAVARLALKFGCQVLPTRIIRTEGTRHKVIVYPPIVVTDTGDMHRDVLAIMRNINSILEGWIREYPGQWFWLHNRWPDAKKQSDQSDDEVQDE